MKTASNLTTLSFVLGVTFLSLPVLGQIRTNSTIRATHVYGSIPRAEPVAVRAPSRPYVPQVRAVDIQRIQQSAQLEKELGVIKTTKTAWMEFDADLMFHPKQKTLKKSAKTLLDKVIAYNCLTCGKGFSVDYDFAYARDTTELGMERSYTLVDYLSQKSGLSPGWFSIPRPEPVQKIAIRSFSYPGERSREPRSVVNIRIQR